MAEYEDFKSIPVGKLGIIPLPGCEMLASKIDYYLVKCGEENGKTSIRSLSSLTDIREIPTSSTPPSRDSGTGEGKCVIKETVRGFDLFILCDPFNYGVVYKMYGEDHPMSPDDHYANLKRAISAVAGKARKITVIMPMLYEGQAAQTPEQRIPRLRRYAP